MADNSYAQLIDDYENGILVEPGETLTQYIDRMGGVDYKADGGSIGIEVLFQPKREEYQTGGISEGNSTSLASLRRQGYKPDSRATTQDYTNALRKVSAGTTYQQQADAKKYARNEAANELRAARIAGDVPLDNFLKSAGAGVYEGYRNIFTDARQGTNRQGAFTSTYEMKKDQLLDLLMNRKLQPTEYSQPKIDQRRQNEFADYMNNLIASTYGKADDYKAEAMTLGMPTSAYFDYLTTSDPKDVMTSYDTLSRDPYFDPKTYVPTDYSNPETPRPPSPYETYFQRELQNQINMGIPQGQRIQQGQVLGLPTVLSGGAPGSQMGPGYESYADVLARNKKMMGLRDGGRVGLFMGGDPLTGQALSIYDSMNAYGFTDQEIANALEAQGLYESGSTPASDTPVTNTATNIINQGGGGGNNSNTLQSFRQDPSVMPAFEALQRNQQLTSMGIKDPFANEASLSGAYYDDMPTDTSNQVGVYQPGIMENIKNKIGGTKIGSMFTGAADKLTNNKFVNALGTAASFANKPFMGGAKMLASGLSGLTNMLPPNQRVINENIAANLGIGVDNIGRIQGDYGTVGGVMSGYNLSRMDADTFDKRTDSISQTLADKYGFTVEEIEDVIDGTYTGKKGFNKIMGKQTNLVRDLRNINKAKEIILGSQQLGLKELERIEKEKADAAAAASYANERQVLDEYFGGSGSGPSGNRYDGASSAQEYASDPGKGATFSGPFKDGGLATMFKNKR